MDSERGDVGDWGTQTGPRGEILAMRPLFPLLAVALALSATPRIGRAQVVDYDALSAADQAPFQAARIPEAWTFLPSALAARDKPTPDPVVIGVIARGMESGAFGGGIAPHPELDFGCDLADPDCELSAADLSDGAAISDQLTAAHSAACGPGTTCADARSDVDHGTLMVGILGAINNSGQGASGGPQLSNGVVAFTSSSSGAASTGSDVPYQLLYNKTGELPAQMVTAISELEVAGAQIILLPFGWSLESEACASDANPNRLTLPASDFASATAALRAAIEAHPGVLFVASAGNCGTDASIHTPGGMPSAPTNLVTVAATEPGTHDAAGFSNLGATVHVGAPGVGVPGPIGYDDQGPVVNAATSADTARASSATADVTTGTGTSVSAALTAGVGGLYLAVTGPLSESGVGRLAQVLRESEIIPGSGLAGVPRLDALRVVESTLPGAAPVLPGWGPAALGGALLGIGLKRTTRRRGSRGSCSRR